MQKRYYRFQDARKERWFLQLSGNKSKWRFLQYIHYRHYTTSDRFRLRIHDQILSEHFWQEVSGKYQETLEEFEAEQSYYRTENIVSLVGDGFSHGNHDFYDQVYRYQMFHQSQPSEFRYKMSTVRDYFKSLEGESLDNLYRKDGDYLPFVSLESNSFESTPLRTLDVWTGFYVTRPFLKKRIYDLARLLATYQNHETLALGSKLRDHKHLYQLEEAVAILTQNSAITGGHWTKAYDDFMRMANEAEASLERLMAKHNRALKGFRVTALDQ
jgi:hypothetical protein